MEPEERDSGEGRWTQLQAALHSIEPHDTRQPLTNVQFDGSPVLDIGT